MTTATAKQLKQHQTRSERKEGVQGKGKMKRREWKEAEGKEAGGKGRRRMRKGEQERRK